MQTLCVSVIFAEHSFRDNPRNTQCSNATAIDCMYSGLQLRSKIPYSVVPHGSGSVPVSWENGDPPKWGPRVPIFLGIWGPGSPLSWENGDPWSPFSREYGDPLVKMGTPSITDG